MFTVCTDTNFIIVGFKPTKTPDSVCKINFMYYVAGGRLTNN